MSPQDVERMAGAGGQHHPPGAAGGAATGASAAVTAAAVSAGPGDDSSDSEAEQEGPQKLIRKVSTSGQIRTKVRRTAAGGEKSGCPRRWERAGRCRERGSGGGGGAWPGAGPRELDKWPEGIPDRGVGAGRAEAEAEADEKRAGAWSVGKPAALWRAPTPGT